MDRRNGGVRIWWNRLARRAGLGLEWDGTTDIISGSAGIGLFLLQAAAELKDNSLIELASKAGDRLVELGKPENGGLKWAMNEKYPRLMPNFSHGTARLFYRLYRITDEASWLDWVKRSANGLMESGIPEKQTPGFWNNAGICCGLAGVGDFFLSLYETTRDKKYLDFCKRITGKLLASASSEGQGLKWIQAEHRTRPELLIAQTGLMQGAAGIGLFLLHLDAFERGQRVKIVLPDTPF